MDAKEFLFAAEKIWRMKAAERDTDAASLEQISEAGERAVNWFTIVVVWDLT